MKKKILSLLMVSYLLVNTVAVQASDLTKPLYFSAQATNTIKATNNIKLQFTYNIFTTIVNKRKSNDLAIRINSLSQLLKYTADVGYVIPDSNGKTTKNPLTEYVSNKYTKKFFTNKSLIVICDSGSFLSRKVTSVVKNNKELLITIERNTPINTFAPTFNHIFIEVNTKDLNKVSKINYNFIDK